MKGKSQKKSPVGNRLCDICGMVFGSATALKEHYSAHTVDDPRVHEKSHACEVCGTDFTQKSDLKEHMQVHAKQKNYECEICKKQFGLLSSVRRHMDTHISLKSPSCKICGEKFKSKKDVRVHMQKVHSEEETEGEQTITDPAVSTLSFTASDNDTPKKGQDNDAVPSKLMNKNLAQASASKTLTNAYNIENVESVIKNSDDNVIVLVIRNGEIEKQIAGEEYFNAAAAEPEESELLPTSKADSSTGDHTIFENDESDSDDDYNMTEASKDGKPEDGMEVESDREDGVTDYFEGDDSDDFSNALEDDRDFFSDDFHDESNKFSNTLDESTDFIKNKVDENDLFPNTIASYNFEKETERIMEKEPDKVDYMNLISDERVAESEETDIFNIKRWKCEICKKVMKHKSTFRNHILIHENVKPFQCELCLKCFRKKANLKEHLLTHGINTGLTIGCHACDVCNKTFPRRNALRAHRRNHSEERPYKCGICGREFKRSSHLKDHLPTHEGKDRKREHICHVCKAGFFSRKILVRHMRLHFAEKCHKCDVCGLGFKRKQHLKEHAVRHQEEREIYHCEECNKDYTNNKAYKNHLSVHKNEERHTCKFCNKKVTKLNKHLMQMHKGLVHEGQHAVETWRQPKVTGKKRSTDEKPTDEKPYKCSVCGQGFKRKSHLTDHSIRHKKNREIYCEKCDKIFTNPRTFKNHMDFHDNKDEHKCKFCGKHYTKLYDHLKRRHKGMIEKEEQSEKSTEQTKSTMTEESKNKSPVGSNYATRSRKHIMGSSLAEPEVDRKVPKVLKNGDTVDNNHDSEDRTTTVTSATIPDDDTSISVKVNLENLESIHDFEDQKDNIKDTVNPDTAVLKSENTDRNETNVSSSIETVLALENIKSVDKEEIIIFDQPNFDHLLPQNFSTTEDIVTSFSPQFHNTFMNVYHQENRKRIKKPERTLICDVCGKVFSKLPALQMHIISHSDQKSFMCEFCGQQYKRKQKLDVHVRKSCKYRNGDRDITVHVCK